MKIIDNLYVVPDVFANCYLIVDPDGITMIDTGIPRSEKKILEYLASLGKSPQDVKRILITHSDWDHMGSLAALHQATGARTYATKIEAEAIASGKSSRANRPGGFSMRRLLRSLARPFMPSTRFQVDEILADGQVLPVFGGLHVVETTGHTPGHISLFAPAAGVLFCGDSMVTDESGIHGSRPQFTWDEGLAQDAVKKQAALGVNIVCSGHGPVVMDAAGKFPL